MRAFVKKVKMDIQRGRCLQPWREDRRINILETDTDTVWEDRNRRIAELKARSARPDAQTETAFSSEITPPTPIPEETMYSGIDAVDDEAKNWMDLNLYRAAMQTDVEFFISVLEQIFDEKKALTFDEVFDQMSPVGNTYLHVAASIDNVEIVRLIARHSPTLITKKNFNGDTALHLAARAGHWCSTGTLLNFWKNLVALPSVHGEDEQQVHQKHFLLRIKNEKGNTALHEALINFHSHISCYLIKEDPEGAFYLNNELESPLTLAAKAGDRTCVSLILSFREELEKMIEQVKAGKSPIHAAIISPNIDVLELMLSEAPRFIRFTDDEGRFPLHFAASEGYIREVAYILDKFADSAIQRDKNGFLPIHWASFQGRVSVINKLLQHCPHPRELIDPNGYNILHLAAINGKHEVLGYILKNPTFEELINMKDKQGNTPLHLAAMNFHPKFVTDLTWRDTRVNVRAVNDKGMTALDVAADNLGSGEASQARKRLTWIALGAGEVPRHHPVTVIVDGRKTCPFQALFKAEYLKDSVATLLLVSTLVATVTFAAGFTMPGSYNNSDPHQGIATMLQQWKFHMFILCDTIAMYSSIIAAIALIWAQLGNIYEFYVALNVAMPILGIAIAMMSLAFMAGVSVVVSELHWLDNAIWIMGVIFIFILLALYYLLLCPISSNYPLIPHRIVRFVNYYPFSLALDII